MLTTYKNILYIVQCVQNFYYNLLQKFFVLEEKSKDSYLRLIRKYYNYNIWIPPIKIRSIFSKFICLFPSAKY